MADVSFLKANDKRSKFRLAQPLRHLPAKHTALGFRPDLSLAGDDEHKGQAIAMRAVQKACQGTMRARLGHAVQVETSLDLFPSPR